MEGKKKKKKGREILLCILYMKVTKSLNLNIVLDNDFQNRILVLF